MPTGLGTYPDVTVVCDELRTDPEDPNGNTVTNPRILVEVLSPSTEEYDRGEKLAHYKRIDTLREVVLVAHDTERLEHWRRVGDLWELDVVHAAGVAKLESVDCTLQVREVYDDPLA